MPLSPVAAQPSSSFTFPSADSTQSPESSLVPNGSAAANSLPALSEMTLDRLLLAKRYQQCSSKQVWEVLMNMNTTAGRELLDSCQVVSTERPGELTFVMATLLCSATQDRTIAKLDEAGIFIDRSRLEHLSVDDAELILSDEGLQLWLRFAASPLAYPTVFVDSILNQPSSTKLPASVASALRVLVISGRDKTNNVPASDTPGIFHLPLAHLCSQVAPEWLSSLLKFGADANQVTAKGVPLVTTAMAAQAERIFQDGHDLLIPHTSLYQLATMLLRHGANLSHSALSESPPPVILLALNGYCAAAEALLSVGAQCNFGDSKTNGNTLMHYLAAATHVKKHSFSAFFLLTLALRYGGDLDQQNLEGVTPCSLLPESITQYLRMSQKMIALARERAKRNISAPTQPHLLRATSNVPPFFTTMAKQANRLHAQGHDPLVPHESLLQLGISLQRGGVDISQRHPDGTPPVLWLALRGYCGAAEVLLALTPNTNSPGQEGDTLMHTLAAESRTGDNAILADYMLTTALRYGGNPTLPNQSGITPLSFLSPERGRLLRAGFACVAGTRKVAQEMVTNRRRLNSQWLDNQMT